MVEQKGTFGGCEGADRGQRHIKGGRVKAEGGGLPAEVGAVLVGVEGLGVEFGMDEAVNAARHT